MFEAVKKLNRKLKYVNCGGYTVLDWTGLLFHSIDNNTYYHPEENDASHWENIKEARLLGYIHESANGEPLCLAFDEDGKPDVYENPSLLSIAACNMVMRKRVYMMRCSSQEDDIAFGFADDEDELCKLLEFEASLIDTYVSHKVVVNTPSFVTIEVTTSDEDEPLTAEYEIFGYFEVEEQGEESHDCRIIQ